MITLAIETAIRGGSLSLLEGELEIDAWIGNKNVSKADDVLEQISKMFARNEIKKIDLISVSTGPGSSTGIRIGLATALGLKKSFNCRIVGVSVFEALTFSRMFDERTLIAIPMGSRQIAWQTYEKDDFSKPQKPPAAEINIGNTSTFQKFLSSQNLLKIIIYKESADLFSSKDKDFESFRAEIIDEKLAVLIGLEGERIDQRNKDSDKHIASDNVRLIYPNYEFKQN